MTFHQTTQSHHTKHGTWIKLFLRKTPPCRLAIGHHFMLWAIRTLLLPKASDTANYQFLAFPQWATSVDHFSFPSKGSITPEVHALTDIGPSSELSLCVWDSPLLAFKVYDVIELATFLFVGTCQKTKRREHFRRLCAAWSSTWT